MIDKHQATAIAALVTALRPEWDQPGVMAQLAKVRHLDPFTTAMACVRAAANPDATTPGVIPVTSGEHWREKLRAAEPWAPPKSDQECHRHPGEWADRCRGCASDQLANQPTEPRRPRERAPDEISTVVGLARAALIRAKANLCPHGVDPERCQHPDHANPTHPRPEHESNEEPTDAGT